MEDFEYRGVAYPALFTVIWLTSLGLSIMFVTEAQEILTVTVPFAQMKHHSIIWRHSLN